MCTHQRPPFESFPRHVCGKIIQVYHLRKSKGFFYSRNAASPPGNGKCSAIPATPPSLRCCWRSEAAAAAAEAGVGGDVDEAGGEDEEERSEAEAVVGVAAVVGGRGQDGLKREGGIYHVTFVSNLCMMPRIRFEANSARTHLVMGAVGGFPAHRWGGGGKGGGGGAWRGGGGGGGWKKWGGRAG